MIVAGEHLHYPMTLAQGEALFRSDVRGAEAAVRHGLGAFPVKQNQFDALVDLTFNEGPAAVAPGNEMMRAIHAGRVTAHNFKEYSMGHIPGERGLHKIPGLLHRREAEWVLYSKGIY
jgi:GH24 family phage-related lysozyme (muramidase)